MEDSSHLSFKQPPITTIEQYGYAAKKALKQTLKEGDSMGELGKGRPRECELGYSEFLF